MIQAVVFDMDGLLVDSEPLWQRARIEAFGADRLRWTATDQERVMGSATQAWADYLAEKLDYAYTPAAIIERVVDQMALYYRDDLPLMPGAHQVIEQLRGRYPLGLASGSSYRLIDTVLAGAGWNGVFDEVLSGDDMRNGKPAPDIYLEITRRMGVAVENTAVFEDSGNGILSGAAAGVKVIAVPHDYHRPSDEVLSQAALVVPSLLAFSPEMLHNL